MKRLEAQETFQKDLMEMMKKNEEEKNAAKQAEEEKNAKGELIF